MAEIDVTFTEEYGRRADGLIFLVRLTSQIGNIPGLLFWVNRKTDELEELRPYRPGMRLGRGR